MAAAWFFWFMSTKFECKFDSGVQKVSPEDNRTTSKKITKMKRRQPLLTMFFNCRVLTLCDVFRMHSGFILRQLTVHWRPPIVAVVERLLFSVRTAHPIRVGTQSPKIKLSTAEGAFRMEFAFRHMILLVYLKMAWELRDTFHSITRWSSHR